MSYPRYVPHSTGSGKWNNLDINAVVDFVNGFTTSGVFVPPYKYLIMTDGTDTYALNGYQIIYGGPDDAGSIDGADASAVIQAAINNCTAARTTKETIVLAGDLGDIHDITAASYTVFQGVQCRMNLAAGEGYFFDLSNFTDVEFKGIHFTATATDRTVDPQALKNTEGVAASNILIENCKFTDFTSDYTVNAPTALFGSYNNLRIINCDFTTTTGNGDYSYLIHVGTCDQVTIQGCTWTQNRSGNGIYIRSSTNVKISGCEFEQTTDQATYAVEAIDLEGILYCNITNNHFKNISIDGVLIGQNGDLANCADITITGNTFYRCGYLHTAARSGVSAMGYMAITAANTVTSVNVSGNVFDTCGIGVMLGTATVNRTITAQVNNNTFVGCAYSIVQYGNAVTYSFSNNALNGCTNPPYLELTPSEVGGNVGYVTEACGVLQDTSPITVTHGLAGVPDVVLVSHGSAPVGSSTAYADSLDTTTFVITDTDAREKVYFWWAKYKP